MKYLIDIEDLNEGVDVNIANEQKKQAQLMEQINKLKSDMTNKIDKSTKSDSERTLAKAKIIQSCAKLTMQLAQSMNTQAQLMQRSAKKPSAKLI